MATHECDLVIVGAGPAGFSAAISGASEGLNVILIDSGPALGGQAAKSSLIENYAGFPEGVSGPDLIGRFSEQAKKFRTRIECPQKANSLYADGNRRVVTTKSGDMFVGKMVILSGGLSYRKLEVPGVNEFMGKGVLYGAPTCDPTVLGACNICIVGGANSAGQAAMHMSRNPRALIRLLVRKSIEEQMSTYLIERIRAAKNIEVVEGVEVTEAHGGVTLSRVTISRLADKSLSFVDANHLFIFIGAQPKVDWLMGTVAMDTRGFIMTGRDLDGAWTLGRDPFGFETSIPGVFCCGDLRAGSTKRIASAGGEGTVALQHCHNFVALNR